MMIFIASVLPAPDSPEMMMDWFAGALEPSLMKATYDSSATCWNASCGLVNG